MPQLYYHTPTKMDKVIKMKGFKSRWVGVWSQRILLHCWQECESVQFFWSTVCQCLIKLNICILSNSTPRYVPNRSAYICLSKDVYLKIHSRTMYKHQKLQTTPVPMIVLYLQNGILYNNTHEQTVATYNEDESQL